MENQLGIGDYTLVPVSQPFDNVISILKISDVLTETSFEDLKNSISPIHLDHIVNDLSQFKQSEELVTCPPTDLPIAVLGFLNVLKTTVRNTVEEEFNIRTDERITVTVSKYTRGDFLLCHDDRSNARLVAFIFYLNELFEEDGGALRFFGHDGEKKPISSCYEKELYPDKNSLVLFRVSDTSHHEVEQIYTDCERVSINGWFHCIDDGDGVEECLVVNHMFKSPLVDIRMSIYSIMAANQMMSWQFFTTENVKDMGDFLQNSTDKALVIHDALKGSFYERCVVELQDCTNIHWERQGPANLRHYETLPFEVEGPHICFGESFYFLNNLIDYLLSPLFLDKLAQIAGVGFAVFEENAVPPACMLEVQRFKEGSYTLLSDHRIERAMENVEVTIFFNVNEDTIGSCAHPTDLSGIVVLSVMPSFSERDYKKLIHLKMKRHYNELIEATKGKEKNKGLLRLQSKSLRKHISSVVEEKVKKLKTYRENSVTPNHKFLTPQDNTMIITYGSSRVSKYSSYIQKRCACIDPLVSYYAVNVTYFTV